MTSSTIICLLLAFIFVVNAKEQWNMFKRQYNKTFKDPLEEEFRFKIFKDNKRKIAEHNQRFDLGLESYETGMNFYGDLLHHEFVLAMNGYKRRIANRPTDDRTVTENDRAVTENERAVTEYDRAVTENERTVTDADQAVTDNEYDLEDDVPESIDWRKQGAVTPVKDQGMCGSCWAFSAIGSLEAQHYFKTKSLVSLSEQNLIDCSDKYGTDGCGGGLMDRAYHYIAHNGGVSSSEAYPYTGQPGNCSYKPETLGAKMSGWSNLPQGSEFHLRHAVATVGPVSVAVDASLQMFQFYKQGIYFERPCSKRDIDHGMLVVGYDSEDGQDYWIVKNSWGTSWGEGGYVRMGRNRKNLCGIATAAIYPNT